MLGGRVANLLSVVSPAPFTQLPYGLSSLPLCCPPTRLQGVRVSGLHDIPCIPVPLFLGPVVTRSWEGRKEAGAASCYPVPAPLSLDSLLPFYSVPSRHPIDDVESPDKSIGDFR
jgi:hypothetical protein